MLYDPLLLTCYYSRSTCSYSPSPIDTLLLAHTTQDTYRHLLALTLLAYPVLPLDLPALGRRYFYSSLPSPLAGLYGTHGSWW